MRVAIISTYPPRACGLASFTADLREAVLDADRDTEVLVVPVLDGQDCVDASAPEVLSTLDQHDRGDYARLARQLNRSRLDVVLVEHEFGIFGGPDGASLLDLTSRLRMPYVLTLHTVLSQPSANQSAVLRSLCTRAAQVTVFTVTARNILLSQGLVTPERVAIVSHGAPEWLRPTRPPDRHRVTVVPAQTPVRELRPFAGRRLMSTFGLLSAGKGLETVLRALPQVAASAPDVVYAIAGRTHPQVVRHEGECYRSRLERLARELAVEESVVFVDRYLPPDEIAALLRATAVFVTPYRSYEQVVSGVLTFALAAGCPVVSTPYLHASEVLRTGAGRLVPFGDHAAVARAALTLLTPGDERATALAQAHRLGALLTWPEVGRSTLKVLCQAAETHERLLPPRSSGWDVQGADTPPVSRERRPPLLHLARLSDSCGIVQHARASTPDHTTGYCVDDVARLAVVAAQLLSIDPADPWFADLAATSVRFLDEAWDPDTATMANLRAVDGQWLDRPDDGDHLGRALWALGELSAATVPTEVREASLTLGLQVLRAPLDRWPRSAALGLLGLRRLAAQSPSPALLEETGRLATGLLWRLDHQTAPGWTWFEKKLTYDNARLPQALLAAAEVRPDLRDRLERAALRALDWYCGQCGLTGNGVLRLVGNRWRRQGQPGAPGAGLQAPSDGDEQPLDAAALVEACVEAYVATGDPRYADRAQRAFAWFHGRNRWGLPLAEEHTGGCHDGVGPTGVNENQGAESTLAYLQAWLTLDRAGLTLSSTPPVGGPA